MNPLARRSFIIVVALLTLGAYGVRGVARFLACNCSGCPVEVVASSPTHGMDAAAIQQLSGEHSTDHDSSGHRADGQSCSCVCHVASFLAVTTSARPLALFRSLEIVLHPTKTRFPADAPRAGIEYPPRAV